jgi:primosomal protein N' (replication factor Y)
VPASLGAVQAGEPVLVPFGRGGRQAIGIVSAELEADQANAPIPSSSCGRSPPAARDGPLLPPLSLALAAWIADHYLAPLATVIRAMLPPGMLERLELVPR